MATTLQIGERVMGGTTADDFDVGTIRDLNGENAVVAWESGVTTVTPLSTIKPYDADHAREMRAGLAA